jgi:HEAT repeat protein
VKGRFLIGVINSIGNRRDAGAADELTKLLGDSDPQVCGAAAAALGRIGNSQTAATLKQTLASAPTAVAPAVADACLACAEELLGKGRRQEAADLYDSVRKAKLPKRFHVAATRGAILTRQSAAVALIVEQLEGDDEQLVGAALRAARELGGHDVAKALIAQLDHSSPKRQVLLLLALRDLGDAAALPALLDAAKSGPPEVRLAAIRCLQQLPSDSAAPLLLAAALESEPEIAQAAQAALAVLPGKQADQEIVAGLDRGSRETRLVMMDLAGRRRIASQSGR